jgi:hypothetical protein
MMEWREGGICDSHKLDKGYQLPWWIWDQTYLEYHATGITGCALSLSGRDQGYAGVGYFCIVCHKTSLIVGFPQMFYFIFGFACYRVLFTLSRWAFSIEVWNCDSGGDNAPKYLSEYPSTKASWAILWCSPWCPQICQCSPLAHLTRWHTRTEQLCYLAPSQKSANQSNKWTW